MRILRHVRKVVLVIVSLTAFPNFSLAAESAFTYQGRLTDTGAGVDGPFDFQFALFDAETAGNGIGSSVALEDVAVSGGLFSVQLDFGADAFNGDPRFLEIGVRPGASSGSYTFLVPRQRVSPTPYALTALNGGISGPNGTFTGNIPQIIRNYTVGQGETIAAGDAVTIDLGVARKGISSTPLIGFTPFSIPSFTGHDFAVLSPTTFVTVVETGGISQAMIGIIDGSGAVTFGSPSNFSSSTMGFTDVARISETKFIIVYSDQGNTSQGTAIIGDVSGTGITYGSKFIFNNANSFALHVTSPNPSTAVIMYSDAGNNSSTTCRVGNVFGNTIIYGPENPFLPNGTFASDLDTLTNSAVVLAYRDAPDGLGYARIGTVSGDTIAIGPAEIIDSDEVSSTNIGVLDQTRFVVSFFMLNGGLTEESGAVVGTVNGTDITFSPVKVLDPATTRPRVIALSPDRVVFPILEATVDPPPLYQLPATVSGQSITLGSPQDLLIGGITEADALSKDRYLLSGNFGQPGESLTFGMAVCGFSGGLTGAALQAGSAGQSIPVALRLLPNAGGISTQNSGLIPGAYYYVQADRTLGLTPTMDHFGRAISATEILFIEP